MLKESLFDLAPRSLDCSRRSVLWPSSLHLLHWLHLFPPSLPTELHNDTGDGMNCKVPHNNKTSIHNPHIILIHYLHTLDGALVICQKFNQSVGFNNLVIFKDRCPGYKTDPLRIILDEGFLS